MKLSSVFTFWWQNQVGKVLSLCVGLGAFAYVSVFKDAATIAAVGGVLVTLVGLYMWKGNQ